MSDRTPLPPDFGTRLAGAVARFEGWPVHPISPQVYVLNRDEAKAILALVQAIDDLKLVYDTSTDASPILACWQQLKEKRALLDD